MTMDELIAKLEAAPAGSRELDGAIREALEPAELPAYFGAPGEWLNRQIFVPSWTRSLDAALTLVPEGWQFGIGTYPENEIFNPGGAQAYCVEHDGATGPTGYTHADAHTAPLALCIAALKARVQREITDG